MVVAAALAGCTSPGGASASRDLAEPPRRGGVLRLVQEAPETLDPAVTSSAYEALLVNQIFDGLVSVDASLNVVPGLASTWSISRDGLTYTFHLRPAVRFHDGTPLTSDDVLFTFRRVLDPGAKRRSTVFSYLAIVSGAMEYSEGKRSDLPGVEAPDPLTVRIRLDRPYISFLNVLTMNGLRVVPRGVVKRLGDEAFSRAPIGTGPFRFASWTPEGIRLAAYGDYFAGPPHLDGVDIVFLGVDETDLGAGRFERNEADIFDVPRELAEKLAGDTRLRVLRYQELSLSFLGFLTGAPPLDDVRVRQAAALAIDRDALVKLSPTTRRFAVGILPPGMSGYSPDLKALPYDPTRARLLLAEAGHAGGKGLDPIVLYTSSRGAASRKVQETIRHDLEEVGLRLDLRLVAWSELSKRVADHDAPAFVLSWIADLTDPDAFLRTLFKSGDTANYFDFLDAKTDVLLEAGARETNPATRARIYREVEKRILEQAPIVPFYHTFTLLAVRRNVRGFEPTPLGMGCVNLKRVWLAARDGAP